MKVYADLAIRGSEDGVRRFIEAIGRGATSTWTRNLVRETEVRRLAFGEMYCFSRKGDSGLLPCTLWIATRRDGSRYVSNILADQMPALSEDQYNEILGEFHDEIKDLAQAHAVELKLGKFSLQLEDYFSVSTAERLRQFARAANRSMPHPLDRHRWNLFLSSAYRDGNRLPAEMLTRWLIEVEHWPEDDATELGAEYERSRDLLAVFEQAG